MPACLFGYPDLPSPSLVVRSTVPLPSLLFWLSSTVQCHGSSFGKSWCLHPGSAPSHFRNDLSLAPHHSLRMHTNNTCSDVCRGVSAHVSSHTTRFAENTKEEVFRDRSAEYRSFSIDVRTLCVPCGTRGVRSIVFYREWIRRFQGMSW